MKSQLLIFLKSADEVIRIHNNVIEKFGGRAGILNKGLLESAISHPWNTWIYGDTKDCKIYNIAAIYFFHIIKNHPL